MELVTKQGFKQTEVGLIPEAIKAPARPEQLEFVYVVER